ncbi:MAG TPA: heat-inducible transcriptional repressor HrcA [Acidimicrobiia bacterium]|nr:heat-inducible transcriptional repressor HrcA [Acidimicrobiia bacterium]
MAVDERRAAILRAVVEGYIETAQPVGSGQVARAGSVNVSPATIRNELSALEADGYLVQPHTSAGRVPTDKGYRFFVDNLVAPGPLDAGRRQQVSSFFASAHGAVEEMLRSTSQLLSQVTDYAAVVVAPPHEQATVRSIQLVSLGGRTVLVVAVLSNGGVEKASMELVDEIGEERLGAATVHLSGALVGSPLGELPPVSPSGDSQIDDLCDQARRAVTDEHSRETDQVYVGGASRMAEAFDAVQTVRQVLSTLEQQYVVVSLLRDVIDRGMTVAIGVEHGFEPLAECSIVVSPYEVEGEVAGTIGVLGPTRMHYPEALAAVAVVSQRLGRRLSEG